MARLIVQLFNFPRSVEIIRVKPGEGLVHKNTVEVNTFLARSHTLDHTLRLGFLEQSLEFPASLLGKHVVKEHDLIILVRLAETATIDERSEVTSLTQLVDKSVVLHSVFHLLELGKVEEVAGVIKSHSL